MSYAIWKATSNNGYVMKMIRLFDHYTRCYDDLKVYKSTILNNFQTSKLKI